MSVPVPTHKPEDLDILVSKAFEEGDIDAACALYEPGAAMVLFSGETTTSADLIRRELEGVIALKPKVTLQEVFTIRNADDTLATTRARGTIDGTDGDGKPVSIPFHTLGVARKQPDGTWRFVIDDPNGSAKA